MSFKRVSIVIGWALMSTLLFEVSAWAAEIKLRDGTLILGQIQQDKLKLTTSYGEIDINVKDIASIVDEKITLRDGSILKGDIIDPQLIVMTKYGQLKLDTKDIASIAFVEEGVQIEKKAPTTTTEKPLTSEQLLKLHDMERAEAESASLATGALYLGMGAAGALVTSLAISSYEREAGSMALVAALAFGGGAVWCWRQSQDRAEKAKKLREELGGRALLNFQNKGNRLCLRIRMPSLEIDSETGQLQWNLINYSF